MQTYRKLRRQHKLLQNVTKTIVTERLIQADDKIIAAVSGGPDSMALLHILHLLQPQMYLKLAAAHLNHCIRIHEAEKEVDLVSKLCRELEIPFYTKTTDVPAYARRKKLNLEEAGRVCRYDFFTSLIHDEGYSKIATGHHSNDNAELILMYLLRGSGPLGISGMPIIRENRIIRPLLRAPQNEIMQYCISNNLEYVSDSTNVDLSYTRNRIRHCLIPSLMQDYNPNVVETLNSMASITRSENEWITQLVRPFYDRVVVRKEPDRLILSIQDLGHMHLALVRRILRNALTAIKGDLRRIGLRHIESIIVLIFKKNGYSAINLPNGILVERINNQLHLSCIQSMSGGSAKYQRDDLNFLFQYRVEKPNDQPVRIHISELDRNMEFSILTHKTNNWMVEAGENVAFFDIERLTFPLEIRNLKAGDRFSPLGLKGTQKLKDYFINAKIPQKTRKFIPIVTSAEIIVWIAGHRCSHFSRIRPQTKHILKAEFFLPKRQQ